MKALLLKDIYNMRFQFITITMVYLFAQIVLYATGTIMSVYLLGVYAFTLVLAIFQDLLSSDEKVQWNSFLFTLPIKRSMLINERYILLAFLIIYVFVLHIIVLNLSVWFHGEISDSYAIYILIAESLVLTIFFCIIVVGFIIRLVPGEGFIHIVGIVIIFLAGTFFTYLFNIDIGQNQILTLDIVNRIYFTSMVCTVPGFILSYIFCRNRIKEREF